MPLFPNGAAAFDFGIIISVPDLTLPAALNAVVLNELDGQLYRSNSATVASYTQLTGGGGGTGMIPVLHAWKTTVSSINNGSPSYVTDFSTEDLYDPETGFTAPSGAYVTGTAGQYIVEASVYFTPFQVQNSSLRILVNDVAVWDSGPIAFTGTVSTAIKQIDVSRRIQLEATDEVRLQVQGDVANNEVGPQSASLLPSFSMYRTIAQDFGPQPTGVPFPPP